jgi:hypothetical protein
LGGETALLALLTGYLNINAEADERMEKVSGLRGWLKDVLSQARIFKVTRADKSSLCLGGINLQI